MVLETMNDKEVCKVVGKFCKKFRIDYLRISMTDFAKENGLNLQAINAFERGKGNNIKYVFYYYNFANNDHLKEAFKNNLFKLFE